MNYLEKEINSLIQRDGKIFSFLQESALDGLWYWDLENPENEWMNSKFWTTLGYNPQEMPHKSSAWQHIINQEDLATAVENFNRHCEDPDYPYDQVVRYEHKNGSTVWIRCRGMAIRNNDGNPVRMLGAHHDVTSLKQSQQHLSISEQQFKGAFEFSAIGMAIVSLEGKWLTINTSFHEMIGYTEKELMRMTFQDITHPDDLKIDLEKLAQLLDGKVKSYRMEKRYFHKKGHIIWVLLTVSMVVNDQGNPLHFVSQIMDITEQKKQFEKDKLIEALKSKSKEMEQFAYITSHDLREPLLTIRNYSELLIEESDCELSEEASLFINTIQNSAIRMEKLIAGLLDYSRLGKIRHLELVDTNQLINDLLQDLYALIESEEAIVRVEHLPNVYAHPVELRIVFQNLIQNAIKFRRKNIKPVIHISALTLDDGHQFQVADNGIGIQQKDTENVFVIFRRLHHASEYEGTGLGLANVKKIVEKHLGEIWVESIMGSGSKFNFTIKTKEV